MNGKKKSPVNPVVSAALLVVVEIPGSVWDKGYIVTVPKEN
jgi:hypothetical protein